MKRTKKWISLLLACTLVMSLCVPAMAGSTSVTSPNETEISKELMDQRETERQRLYNCLEEQLRAQNALDKIDLFAFLVEETIEAKYSGKAATASAERVYAPDGGWMQGNTSYIEAEAQFFSPLAAEELYYLRQSNPELVWDFLVDFGLSYFIGNYAVILSLAALSSAITANMMWNNINIGEEGVVIYSVYDKMNMSTTTVLWSWNDYPYMDFSTFYLDTITDYDVF